MLPYFKCHQINFIKLICLCYLSNLAMNISFVFICYCFVVNMQTYFSLNVISSCVCYLLYSIKMRTAEMQLKNYQPNTYSSSKLLQKCTSMPSFTDTTNSSNSSIESNEDEYRKSAIKWILNYSKKIAKDTHYLAITYLNKLVRKYVYLSEENY